MKKRSLLIIVLILILLFLYFFVFWIWGPFDAEITQDKFLIRALCNMQVACHSSTGPYTCREDPSSDSFKRLSKWDGFKGCNNMTKGYQQDDNRIILEYCGCGGWM